MPYPKLDLSISREKDATIRAAGTGRAITNLEELGLQGIISGP
jgi:hypothetical protein